MDGPLSLPVIIPQQRPGSRTRGFIAAYSPVLETVGIDQTTFLKFLDDANIAMRGNKLLAGVEAAAFGVGFAPEILVMLIATAVEAGAYVANKGYIRKATNSALDKYNEELFGPRGLFCMIMKYEPKPKEKKLKHAQSTSSLRKTKSMASSIRSPITGTMNGPGQLPIAVAPLIYIDDRRLHRELVAANTDEKPSSFKIKNPKTFDNLSDYFDRRARARYAVENAGDVLSVPARGGPNDAAAARPTTSSGFVGKFKDPDRKRPQNQEHFDIEERRLTDEYRWQVDRIRNSGQTRQEVEWQLKRCEDYYQPKLYELREQRKMQLDPSKKRKIKKHILYLTIVNKPSDAQLAHAMQQLQQNNHQYGQPVQI